VAKSNANNGSAAVLDDGAGEFFRSPAGQEPDERAPRTSRTTTDHTTGDREEEGGEPFLRARRRVPVRRGLLPGWARSRWGKVAFVASVAVALGLVIAAIAGTRSFLDHDARFRIASGASIQILGNSELTRADLLSVFGADIGRNVFLVPLESRRTALEQLPWVERATVMRLLPNQLRVAITERTPIAFVQVRGRIELADVNGVILAVTPEQMSSRHYSFAVVTGINPADPLSVRSARMHLYQKFIGDLDASGEHVSSQLSEVDLSDPDDVRATVPANGTDLVLHFGQEDFLARWHNYQAHIAQWMQQYPHLASIDLRYDHEVVLKMAGDPGTTPESKAATKAAASPAPTAPAKAPTPARAKTPAPAHHASAAARAGHKAQAGKHHPPAKTHETQRHDTQTQSHARRPA